jgi:hypothetical protein
LKSVALPWLFAFAALPLACAAVDTTERNQTFNPKPTKQERVEKERTEIGESRAAAETELEFATVSAAEALVRTSAIREKQSAPIDRAARPFPSRQPEPARISTDRAAPVKFARKVATPTATRIQDGMNDAGRVKTTKTKTGAKPSVLERINRFVFRRNAPAPATAPAGGENKPADGAAAPADSSSP